MHWKGSSSSPAYSAGWGLWFITRRRASLPLPRQITSTPGAQACREFRLCHYHLGQDEQPVSLQLASRRDYVYGHVPVIKELVVLFHLRLAVQQQALALDTEGGQGVVVVDYGHFAVYGAFQLGSVAADVPEKALDLVEFPPLHVVRIQHPVAELLGALGAPR